MWFYVATEDNKEPWVGTISREDVSGSRWTFEAIRHVAPAQMYDPAPFDDTLVHALLDHQQRCTILRPLVTLTDPGKMGMRFDFMRTRVKGQCDAILYDLIIESEDAPSIAGFSFESPTFATWFAAPGFSTDHGPTYKTHTIEVAEPQAETFKIDSWGTVTCVAGASLSSQYGSAEIRSSALFKVDFENPRSLRDTIELCHGFERLFGFLIGFRLKPPLFKVWTGARIEAGEFSIPQDGILDLGGLSWAHDKTPHPFECVNIRTHGLRVEDIVARYLSSPIDFSIRMHAVDFSRHLSTNLNDKLSVLLPVLEDYLKRTYTGPDEESYANLQQRFFDWVDSSPDADVQQFSKKHIVVKGSKTPGLKTLVARAIADLNAAGAHISDSFAERLQKRRGRAFHGPTEFDDNEAQKFYAEIRAATAILMLLTYRDLGVDLGPILNGPLAYRDLRGFVPKTQAEPSHANAQSK